MTSKRAFITGITGQDGSYLAQQLLESGYEVHGLYRRRAGVEVERVFRSNYCPDGMLINGQKPTLIMHEGDITDRSMIGGVLASVDPHEVYHLAAESHVGQSFRAPLWSLRTIVDGTLNVLQGCRSLNDCRIYIASSSEMYGNNGCEIQDENSPFRPCSPYASAKLCAHNLAVNFREAYGMFVCCGILFNHESPRRGVEFVTRKASLMAARAYYDPISPPTEFGDMTPRRDWGYAPDYVNGMRLMLGHDRPDDYVLATGISISVRHMIESVFESAGIKDWKRYIVDRSNSMIRPNELKRLQGDSSKACTILGWKSTKDVYEVIDEMVKHDIRFFTPPGKFTFGPMH